MPTYKIKISGIVQGVGFRPFIYNLAGLHNLKGEVFNTTSGVIIYVNAASRKYLDRFLKDIKNKKPPAALIESISASETKTSAYYEFKIISSKKSEEIFQLISPDLAVCSECLKELNDKNNIRRYRYPFTNCTNCGPRFTIIKKLPYDRPNTTMSEFKMCGSCEEEYNDPNNRRFHAQPNACNNCGPQILLYNKKVIEIKSKDPVKKAAFLLKKGKIVAIKGIGGFQIACDAQNSESLKLLRKRKNRPFKPFAVMFKDIETIKDFFIVSGKEENLLKSSAAPIVLLRKKKNKSLSYEVSFNNKFEGVMLPYTPLHHMLLNDADIPLIMTSGNISEEPIVFENNEAFKKLGSICSYFLIHNRDIYSRYDDSLAKVFKDKIRMLRRARGYSPFPLKLHLKTQKANDEYIFAAGSEEKNSFCIIKNNYAIISQHIGDIDNSEAVSFYRSTLDTYKDLFGINKFKIKAEDDHPDFLLNKIIKEKISEKTISVQHHKAHIASVIAENNIKEPVLGFSWDGTGYGDDGIIWGSEIFLTDKFLNFLRIGHLATKFLPGGQVTIKKPYRMAVSYLYLYWKNSLSQNMKKNEDFLTFLKNNFSHLYNISKIDELNIITTQTDSGFNSILTTSMGRLFDAVSSILNFKNIASFEGEAAIELEMNCKDRINSFYKYSFLNEDFDKLELPKNFNLKSCIDKNLYQPVFLINDLSIISEIVKDIKNKTDNKIIASKFHNTLAEIILEISIKIRNKFSINKIALSGGVFQNNYLFEKIYNMLENKSFEVYANFMVPVNDGGISLGQAYTAYLELKERNK